MDQAVIDAIIGGGFWVTFFVLLVWGFERGNQILDNWAKINGYKLIKSEYKFFSTDWFFLTASRGQSVYRVTVIDNNGTEKSGFVRCGGYWLGLLTDKISVKWDK